MLVLVSLFRVPQIMERLFPFSVLIGAMACFFSLSRRMELVVARGAGMSVWQIIAPGALGRAGARARSARSSTTRSRRTCARVSKRHRSRRFSASSQSALDGYDSGYWVRQRGSDGESIMNALPEPRAGAQARLDHRRSPSTPTGEFKERIEAKSAELKPGAWQLTEARVYAPERAAAGFRNLLAADQTDARAGRRKFRGARHGRVLAPADLYPLRRGLRPRRGRLPTAVPAAAGAAVPAGGDGPARRLVQPARVPVRRRAATNPDRHRRRLLDLRALEGDART